MTKANKKGFTLIEIVIVLAIAALIMVIVFLAVAGAQRSQRDTAAKNSANAYLAAMAQYSSNNSGTLPTTDVGTTYFDQKPSGSSTRWSVVASNAAFTGTPAVNTIYASTNATCNGSSMAGGTASQSAVVVKQENGTQYCVSQ